MNELAPTSDLNPIQKQQICSIMQLGCTQATAAKHVGCGRSAIRAAAGRDLRFAADLRRAEAQNELTLMKNVFEAAQEPKNWRASVWSLERVYPERYLRRLPDAVTAEQLVRVIESLVDVVADEVTDTQRRERIVVRIGEVTRELRQTAQGQDQLSHLPKDQHPSFLSDPFPYDDPGPRDNAPHES